MDKKIVKSILMLIFLVLFLTSCYDPGDQESRYPSGISSYDDIRIYAFDPRTILTVQDQSDGAIFQPLPGWSDQGNIFQPGSFAWQQQDYLKVAGALNQIANQDNLEGWNLYSLSASRNCADTPIGFDRYWIIYFKTVAERYTTREMDIYPLQKEAVWAGNIDFPRPFPFGWKSVDLKKLKITADDALQRAETNGGMIARQAVNNACNIFIGLTPNADNGNWSVSYFGDNATTLFHFSIYAY
jgi:hypothetical protein